MKKSLLILSCVTLALASCGNPESTTTTTQTSEPVETTGTPAAEAPAAMLPGEKLVAMSDCVGCHNKTQKVIGPSYVDIAAKYPSTAENIELLSESILKGSKGKWGELPMTPHAGVSKDDAKSMVTWILSLKK